MKTMPMKSVSASTHQGNASFFGNNAGYQCTAIALAALIFASISPANEWTSSAVNNVLFFGDSIYTRIVQSIYLGQQVYLMPSDLPTHVRHLGHDFVVSYRTDEIHGTTALSDSNTMDSFMAVPLEHGLVLALSDSDFALLTVGQLTLGIIHDSIHDTYHVFDSHSRDEFGNPSENGASLLLSFSTLQELCAYFQRTYINQLFNLTPVSITDLSWSNENEQDSTLSHRNACQGNHTYSMSSQNANMDSIHRHETTNNISVSDNNVGSFNCINKSGEIEEKFGDDMETAVTGQSENECEMGLNTMFLHNHTYSLSKRLHGSDVNGNSSDVHDPSVSCNSCTTTNEENHLAMDENYGDLNRNNIANVRRLNDTINLHHLTSLPEHFRLISTNDNLNTNPGHNDVCMEVPLGASVSVQELSIRENLRMASQIKPQSDKDIMAAYVKDIGLLPTKVCVSCKHILLATEVVLCNIDNKVTESCEIYEGDNLCRKCFKQIRNEMIPKESYCQNRLDAGHIPTELRNLFVVEKRLLSLIPVFLTLIVLPGGQFAQHGIAVNIPINMNEQLAMLPRYTSSVINSPVLISFARPNKDPVTLPVRLPTLLHALTWLKENNHLYADFDISDIQKSVSVDAGYLKDMSQVTDLIEEEFSLTVKDSSIPEATFTLESSDNPDCSIPIATQRPVNIKNQAFGEEKAFPWLFPAGNNGLGTKRSIPLTDLAYFHTRLYHEDPRWRCDIPYVMSSLNLHEWNLLTSTVSCYMRTQKPISGESRNFVPVSAEDLNNVRSDPVLMQNSYMFTKHIRGTAAYWKSALVRLLAMVKTLGPPTFFVTLSCNDNWPELQAFIALDHTVDHQSFVKDNPLMAALAFEQRWHALLKHVLRKKQPLGRVLDFFARVEFQARGSPHMHVFLWTDLGKNFGISTARDIVNVINQTICTTLPVKDSNPDLHRLVNTFQMHKHSFTCKKGNRRCRFDFPRRTCSCTKLCFDPDVITHHRGRFYETVRRSGDVWINAYNPVILKHWRANMDIQLVGNAESCAFYVCKYVCKAEPEELRETLGALFADPNFQSLELRKRLILIGTCVLKKRKISAQEAMYRLGGLKLYESSRSILNIVTLPKLKRFKLIKPKAQREHLPADCTEEHLLFESNIVDYYRARPLELEHICLHEFASWYSRDSGIERPNSVLPRIRLRAPYSHIVFRKRSTALIVQPTKIKQTSDDYYYSCLLLFFPHRTEGNLIIPFCTYRTFFSANFENLDKSYESIHSISCELEEAVRRIHLINAHEEIYNDVYDQANGTNQMSNYSIYEQGENNVEVPNNINLHSDEREFNVSDELTWHSLTACSANEASLERRISCLSSDQKHFFSIICKHFKDHTNKEKIHLFCTGGAGTGKSYLLRVIVDWLCLCHPIQPGHSSVVVTAPTGVAARNVLGHTLHSIFRLPVQHGYEPEFHELPAFALKKLRDMFRSIHTIIIDEISMVSSKHFHYIHQRLCSIANNDLPFGGFNVILFGDFYQLRPVRGFYVFTDSVLWPLFSPCILRTNQRQQGYSTFISLLNRMRIGDPSPEDIALLHSKLIPYPCESKKHLLHIFPKKKQVRAHNRYMQSQLDSELHTFTAEHIFSQYDVDPGHDVPSSLIPEDDTYAGGLPNELQVSVGTRVMLLRNLLTKEGLVNGAMGIVTHIEVGDNESERRIYVRFDDENVGRTLQSDSNGYSIPITLYTQEFLYCGRYINRIQFPLMPCWACTVHKLQGISIKSAVVCLGLDIFQAGQAYVALSRICSLDGVYLTSLCPQRIYADPSVMTEYVRLIRLVQKGHISIQTVKEAPNNSNFKNAYLYVKALVVDQERTDRKFTVVVSDSTGVIKASVHIGFYEVLKRAKDRAFTLNLKDFLAARGQLYITEHSIVLRSTEEVLVPEELKQQAASLITKPNNVAAAKTSPLKTRVSLKGKIVKVTPIKKVTIQRTQQDRSLLSVHIKDATGVIPMTLWGKIAEQHTSLKVGDCVSVHQAERGTFSNKPTLNTWEDTTKVELVPDDMDISDTDDELPGPSTKKVPDGSCQGVWTMVGNVSTYRACPKERCFLKKLEQDICPTCHMPVSEDDQVLGYTATAGLKLHPLNTEVTVKMFTNTLKSAYTQLRPGCTMPEDPATLEDELIDNLPLTVSCIINPSNILTKITIM